MVQKEEIKIIIVGAGASGIAAGTKLLENGFNNITILEAENRIGGRINSVEFGGSVVDIGGQWVHGEKNNIIYEMVKDLDLIAPSSLPPDPGMSFFLPNGTSPDKTITDKLFATAIKVKDDKETASRYRGNFAEYFTTEYKKRVKEDFFPADEDILQLSDLVLDWFKKFMILLNPAESWNQLSTTSHYVFQPCEGDPLLGWKGKGYKTIIDVMKKKIPDPSKELPIDNKIIVNKEVNRIIWNRSTDDKVIVKCSDGSKYSADHVIVTVSVGVLKDVYKKVFEPALPNKKVNAIENVPLGTVNKILLKFPYKWWPSTVKDISFLWSEEDKESLREFSSGPVVNGRSWLENLFSFIAIDSHPNVLLGWVNGPTSKLVELLPDESVISGAMYMLRKFAGKQFDIPEPNGILRSKWGSNPHFRGSYTYVSANMENAKASANDLAEPLIAHSKPAVLFAGESTHATLFSTVSGAMETGYREAQRIIDFYRKNA
ncbi:spermine oxidase [Sitophilus oryzae]|uniref:Spermine oxidase n=1 Tax=Sitophilus oryzae TaxID=7048 RepID=A0A6J2YWC8_SITOR|nr:spermine oxidase [Sitophilus oryzae]